MPKDMKNIAEISEKAAATKIWLESTETQKAISEAMREAIRMVSKLDAEQRVEPARLLKPVTF